ncbi:uncharacterized protein LOC108624990 [Ceratina calcarata]|uniref:Uncharacterized protein LOC108624990 n=1 Tax=Ceratina calcarata TaxID=156304 RepID=A0AAJ7IZ10_9HYME|nr:uncharacterized protein LOC108624990 [Ceratina calcarata]XP_026669377.1 uncharacterized protein LOC108624990 [Ceratina calcarata]
MKLLLPLILGCCSVLSETATDSSSFLARASAQLERLDTYRRPPSDRQPSWLEILARDPGIGRISSRRAFEIYRLLPDDMQVEIANKVGGNRAMIELLADSKDEAMQDNRIKRSGSKREIYDRDGYESPPEGYQEEYAGYEHYGPPPQQSGSDSGSIIKGSSSVIGGIAQGLISGLVSASGTASKGSSSISAQSSQSSVQSSSSSSDTDKPKPEYGQVYSYGDKAFDVWDFKKAIVSTLMQAVKAISGGVIALKGQLIKGSGYLVSTKGKIIAKAGDAVTSLGRNIAKSAVTPPPHPGYSYHQGGHDESYGGPPPAVGEYLAPNEEYHGNPSYHSTSDADDEQAGLLIAKPTKPDDDHHDHGNNQHSGNVKPEDDYQGPPPEQPDKENAVIDYQNFHRDNENAHHPTSFSYGVPPVQLPLEPLNPVSIQQSVEYPPIHLDYFLPNKDQFELPNGDDNDLSVYSSLTIDMEPDSIKAPLKGHAGFHDFHMLPMQGPLKIPLLGPPHAMPYWQNQPVDFNGLYRRRNSAQRRRSARELAQWMRLQRG